MSENKGYPSIDSNLAADTTSYYNEPAHEVGDGSTERELRALMDNPRCPEGLRKALWGHIVSLRAKE